MIRRQEPEGGENPIMDLEQIGNMSVDQLQARLSAAKQKLELVNTSLQKFRNKNFEVCWSTDY